MLTTVLVIAAIALVALAAVYIGTAILSAVIAFRSFKKVSSQSERIFKAWEGDA